MKTLKLLALLAAAAYAQNCPFAPVPLDTQYLGHALGTMNARFRVAVPVDGCGLHVLARDPMSGRTETWWIGSCDATLPADRIFVREASPQSFPSGHLVLELWAGNYSSLCSSTGPIAILPYVAGVAPYGPIMTGANRLTLQVVDSDSLSAPPRMIRVSGALPGSEGVLVVSHAPAFESLMGGTLLVNAGLISGIVAIRADNAGGADLLIFAPATAQLPRLYLQAAFRNYAIASPRLSNGLRLDPM